MPLRLTRIPIGGGPRGPKIRPAIVLASMGLLLGLGTPVSTSAVTATSVPTCLADGGRLTGVCLARLNGLRIAVIQSVFSTTPYAYFPSASFYAFYHAADAAGVANCTQLNTQWLTSKVVDDWGQYGQPLNAFLQSSISRGYFNGSLTEVLTDVQVGNGGLFAPSGKSRFDVVVVGFAEYATASEYDKLKSFVSKGGLLVVLSPAFFRGEVTYDPAASTERLVSGHGWSFDGTSACRGVDSMWHEDKIGWLGGDYCCFYTSGFAVHGGPSTLPTPSPRCCARRSEAMSF